MGNGGDFRILYRLQREWKRKVIVIVNLTVIGGNKVWINPVIDLALFVT